MPIPLSFWGFHPLTPAGSSPLARHHANFATLYLIVNTFLPPTPPPPTYLEKRLAGPACKSGVVQIFLSTPPPPPTPLFAHFATAGVTIITCTYQ